MFFRSCNHTYLPHIRFTAMTYPYPIPPSQTTSPDTMLGYSHFRDVDLVDLRLPAEVVPRPRPGGGRRHGAPDQTRLGQQRGLANHVRVLEPGALQHARPTLVTRGTNSGYTRDGTLVTRGTELWLHAGRNSGYTRDGSLVTRGTELW